MARKKTAADILRYVVDKMTPHNWVKGKLTTHAGQFCEMGWINQAAKSLQANPTEAIRAMRAVETVIKEQYPELDTQNIPAFNDRFATFSDIQRVNERALALLQDSDFPEVTLDINPTDDPDPAPF